MKKKQRRSHPGSKTVAGKIEKWKEAAAADSARPTQKALAKGCKKGSLRGKGGPNNANCKLRGVRRRVWGEWAAEDSYELIIVASNCFSPCAFLVYSQLHEILSFAINFINYYIVVYCS